MRLTSVMRLVASHEIGSRLMGAYLVREPHPLGEQRHAQAVGDHAQDEEVQAQRVLRAVAEVNDLSE